MSESALNQTLTHNGSQYLKVLSNLHKNLSPKLYLEVGVNKGDALVLSNSRTIAVDPRFEISRDVIGKKPELHFYQQTSDDFFKQVSVLQCYGSVDLAFLDGLHHAEFLLRDFINAERVSRRESVIVLHDCLPTDIFMARRDQFDAKIRSLTPTPALWSGDVWKVLSVLRASRPDLKFVCLDSPPTGLVLVTSLDPNSRRLSDEYDRLVEKFPTMLLSEGSLRNFHQDQNIKSTAETESETKLRDLLLRSE